VRVGHRRDVDHEQALDQLGAGQREVHGDLAAQAVADQRDCAEAVALHERRDVARHLVEAHGPGPGRAAVVAQIQGEHAVARGELLGDAGPVARRAQQAVQDHHGWPGLAEAIVGKFERHSRFTVSMASPAVPGVASCASRAWPAIHPPHHRPGSRRS
jgi:hypothetical protein